MPLKFQNTKQGLKILWENEDKSRTASFLVPKEAPEVEQVRELLKVVGFLGAQTGLVPQAATMATTATVSSASKSVASTAAPQTMLEPGPPTAYRVPMMPPASLSDRPSDGGRPRNAEFWENQPTTQLPATLQTEAAGAWEFIPPEEL